MEWWLVLVILFGSMVALMLTGLPVAFVFLAINLVGVVWFWGAASGLDLLILSIRNSVTTFAMLPIPMFVLLGEVMFHSGMGIRAMDVLDKWMGRLPGRLGLLSVASATLFSTLSGSSIATTAMLGSVLVPEMEKRGYKKPMSIGPVMGSGGLAMIIPPSGIAVLLAAVAEISIARLLLAGVIPGLVIAFFYASYIIGRCYLQPSIAPSYAVTPTPLSEKMIATVRYVLPLGLIIFLVIGLIFMGLATPSEAAATGALGSLLLAAIYRSLNWEVLRKAIMGTVRVTVMVLMIITGATIFSQIVAFSGASRGLIAFATGLSVTPIVIIIVMQALLLFLGMFLGIVPLIMICTPLFFPLVQTLGFDLIWFALLMLINLEMAQTTPPFGTLLFVMKGVAPPDTTFADIYKAGIPFLLCDLTTMALVLVFPILALWMPNIIR